MWLSRGGQSTGVRNQNAGSESFSLLNKHLFFIRTFYNASSVALAKSVDNQRAFSGFFYPVYLLTLVSSKPLLICTCYHCFS